MKNSYWIKFKFYFQEPYQGIDQEILYCTDEVLEVGRVYLNTHTDQLFQVTRTGR